MSAPVPLARRCFAEALGSAALLAIVVGSGIMGERLAGGNDAIALLANSVATGAGLLVLISTLGPLSGAHFNPLVSLMDWFRGALAGRDAVAYIAAQLLGAVAGVVLANLMFDLPPITLSSKLRASPGVWLSEVIATGGLLLTILLGLRHRAAAVPALVACYITAAYWFTASTAFANPSVTLARTLTATFSGIAPSETPGLILAQCLGALVGLLCARLLLGSLRPALAGGGGGRSPLPYA